MKNLVTAAALVVLATASAYAADDKSGSMQGDMMKNCQSHMKDGKMMDNMPKDMMAHCQKMMKGGMMQPDGAKDAKPMDMSKPADDADHTKHHE